MSIATVIELLLVPVLYGIFVLDPKIIKWDTAKEHDASAVEPVPSETAAG